MLFKYRYKSITILFNEVLVDPWLFFTGFKGYGLVGYITTLYLAEHLGCERKGMIITKYMPEAVSVDEKGLVPPFDIYHCSRDESDIVVLVNHELPSSMERTRFTEAIARWLRRTGFREAVYFGGFDARFRSENEEYRWIATSKWKKKLSAPGMIKGLYVVGPLALLLLFSELNKIAAAAILPYSEPERPDPRAAAVAIKVVNELYGLNVPVENLLEEAAKVEEMIAQIEQQKEAREPSGAERAYM